jgi:hypothetical protein
MLLLRFISVWCQEVAFVELLGLWLMTVRMQSCAVQIALITQVGAVRCLR